MLKKMATGELPSSFFQKTANKQRVAAMKWLAFPYLTAQIPDHRPPDLIAPQATVHSQFLTAKVRIEYR